MRGDAANVGLDLSQARAGGYCTQLAADAQAVTHLPKTPDDTLTRALGDAAHAYYLTARECGIGDTAGARIEYDRGETAMKAAIDRAVKLGADLYAGT